MDEVPSLSIFRSIILEFFENVKLLRGSDKHRLIHKSNGEFADQYQAHACLGLLKNKPQINADERRLIESDDDPYLSILSSHLFNRTYSSHNHCL